MTDKRVTRNSRFHPNQHGSGNRHLAALLTFGVVLLAQSQWLEAGPRGVPTCPEPIGPLPLCGALATIDCDTGGAGDECWPLTLTIDASGAPVADQCTCAVQGSTCGPIAVLPSPGGGLRYVCEGACTPQADECHIQINGVSSGSSIADDSVFSPGDVVTCGCTPPPAYENWVIADDFCVKGCDRCQCDVNGDNLCDPDDIQFWNLCSANPGGPGCIAADVNCDGSIDQADLIIIDCQVAGGTLDQCCPGSGTVIDRLRWYGSYFDTDFEPPAAGGTPLRRPDSWLVGLHTNIPEVACPPVPAGTKPVDWCGRLEACTSANELVFRPDGSAFTYNFADPSALLGGYGVGDQIRICGHDDSTLNGLCTDALSPVVVIDGVADCQSKVSRPDRLIAQWVLPDPLVTVDPTTQTGCDGHNVFCYTADLPNACLVHDFSQPGEIDPITGAINPIPGKIYWLSIQAAVGHTVDLTTCAEVATAQTVTQDFWGWHTTPPGHQHKDDAYMGSLGMTCVDGWVYNWMGHLHSSQPAFLQCADDPTKSVDMAFYLIDADGFCGGDPTQPCQSNLDCDQAAGITCVTTENVHWCQPIKPGQPTTPGPAPDFPYGQIDELSTTVADVLVNLDILPGQTLNLSLQGPMVVWRGIEHEDIGGTSAVRTVQTEILSMDLSGFDPSIGPVRLRVSNIGSSGQDGVRSTGQVSGGSDGSAFPATASFDVFFEVEVSNGPTGAPLIAVSEGSMRMTAQVWELPPSNVEFLSDPTPITLIDRDTRQPIGTVKSVSHFVPYKGGVNVHSDVDWANTPVEECCQPLADGTACEQTICPDANETCVPVEYDCSGTCLGTTLPCTIDSDCLDFCVQTCRVTDCDCRLPDECHAVVDTTVFGPISCKGPCPTGQICDRVEIDTDTPPDGVTDKYRCDCGDNDPLICPLPDPTNSADPCINLQATDCITDTFGNKVCRPRFVTSTINGALVIDRCECFETNIDECGPIAVDQATGDLSCSGACPPLIPGDCMVFADGVSLGRPTANISDADIPVGATLWCDCQPTPPAGACCFDADGDGVEEACAIMSPTDCAANLGTFHGTGTLCGVIGACCLDTDGDGVTETCHEMDSTCCEDSGGTFNGAGSICEGDLNGNGVDDACDCDTLPVQRIKLHSGNGAVGGLDTAIRVLPGPAAGPVSTFPFSPGHFKHACKLPPANVIAPNPAWLPGSSGALPADPLAQWIGTNPNSAINSPASGLFCQEFEVCCPNFTTATITISFAADDQIGDNPFGPNNIGVYINGSAVPGFFGVGFGSQIVLTGPVGGVLTPGTNQLHVYLRDVYAVASGLIYSVTIDVDCDREACCFPDDRCEDLDPCCCRDLGGTPQGVGTDCTTVDCGGGAQLCKLPALAGTVDPCDALQATDCVTDVPGQLCVPVCTQNAVAADGTLVPIATECTCVDDSGDCGPVKIVSTGGISEFVCDPSFCPAPDLCQIHLNGSPTGVASIPTANVGPGKEVKCRCASVVNDPCPTPLPPSDDICGALQATDCINGTANDQCLPICIEVVQDATGLTPTATACDCIGGDECGPVQIVDVVGATPEFVCNPTVCPVATDLCQIHLNGSPTGTANLSSSAVAPGTEVKCKCGPPDVINDPCPTPLPPSDDLCGPLQATDCVGGTANDRCLPICIEVVQDATGLTPTATACDCIGGDECGPVQIVDVVGATPEFVCNPTVCPVATDLCQIHLNGSPTGTANLSSSAVAPGTEVKCKCGKPDIIDDPCPTPLPPAVDPCGALQATDCVGGVSGERCVPICMQISQDATGLVPTATKCDCADGTECGPVETTVHADGTLGLSCNPSICPVAGVSCVVHINGVAFGSSVDVNSLVPADEVKCRCPSLIATPVLPGVIGGVDHNILKNRFISVDPNNTTAVSLRVELLDQACSGTGQRCNSAADCKICVGGPVSGNACIVNSNCGGGTCTLSGETCDPQSAPVLLGWASDPVQAGGDALPGTFISDVVKPRPAARTWTESVVHIGACEIAPVRTYAISATTDGIVFSSRLVLATINKPQDKFWGDLVGNFNGFVWSPPNNLVGVDDVNAVIKFLTNKPAPHVTVVDLVGSAPTYVNTDVNASDLQIVLKAFQAKPFPPAPLLADGYPANGDVTLCP